MEFPQLVTPPKVIRVISVKLNILPSFFCVYGTSIYNLLPSERVYAQVIFCCGSLPLRRGQSPARSWDKLSSHQNATSIFPSFVSIKFPCNQTAKGRYSPPPPNITIGTRFHCESQFCVAFRGVVLSPSFSHSLMTF